MRFRDVKLIEEGWLSYAGTVLPPDEQVASLRRAFLAGARHFWRSCYSYIDPTDDEEINLQRMDMVNIEMINIVAELREAEKMNPKKDRKARIRRIRRENFEIVRAGRGRYTLRVKIDHQSFQIAEMGGHTKEQAWWTATQAAIALNRFKFGD